MFKNPIAESIDVTTLGRSGDKYWLSPKGEFFHVREHSLGARELANRGVVSHSALESIGINPDRIPLTFGVTEFFKLGWHRIIATKEAIWVTGQDKTPNLNHSSEKALNAMADRFATLNAVTPEILAGDGGSTSGRAVLIARSSTNAAVDKMDADTII